MKKVLLMAVMLHGAAQAQNLTQYVNPFIGTGGHGHTYPGATLPFGAVQLSPDTRPDGYNDWDGCGGYHYSDSLIYGFSHTHLSGTGVADYCDVLLMPTTGAPVLQNISNGDPKTGYASLFHHSTEKAAPGYYSVQLEDDGIAVELTATARTGMHAYHFPKSNEANIILDLMHRDMLLDGSYIEIISPTKIQGLRRSSSWARDQWVYFAIEFSQPFITAGIQDTGQLYKTSSVGFRPSIVSGRSLKAYFRFHTNGTDPVITKCALSAVSCSGAWENMAAENPGWNFAAVRKQADETWNKALGKILVESPEDAKKATTDPDNKLVIFYTALYHCLVAPNIYEDVDGQYRGIGNKIGTTPNHTQYTVFSLWDTFRALHPLFTIIEPERTSDFIQTFLRQYQDGGRLPVWELSANETDCMIGYHSVSVITDAAVKGIGGFDTQLAMQAMKTSANSNLFGLPAYRDKGFIESNDEPESVSKTLEYAYDDWCIAQFADHALHTNTISPELAIDKQAFLKRGFQFQHVLNTDGFAQPRFNGGWYTPFDPFEVNFNYTEANSWQYSFFYPQYLPYIDTPEEKAKLENRLDALFTAKAKTTGREQADITGLIGQYAHGNEPSHHIAYLYNYANAAWKTQEKVREICTTFYKNAPDGLIGNEDCGQMSAWYVMSAMGMYPVCPGTPEYTLTTPLFPKIIINGAHPFAIQTTQDPKSHAYIAGAELNAKPVHDHIITHNQITQGGALIIDVAGAPVKTWGIVPAPEIELATGHLYAPVINAPGAAFQNETLISISTPDANTIIEYAIDSSGFNAYTGPFSISNSCTVKARTISAQNNGSYSPTVTAKFTKISHALQVIYETQYNSQYTGGGATALIDGLSGSPDFRTGQWQGWWGEDMSVVVDLGKTQTISQAGGEFFQDVRSWIWIPKGIEISISENGKKFTQVAYIENKIPGDDYNSKTVAILQTTFDPVKARYVRIRAINYGPVPEWHPGKGGNSWVFCDEVFVK